jgi:hypothetical protein
MAEATLYKDKTLQDLPMYTNTPESQAKDSTEEVPEPASSIAELQAAFGSILLATKSSTKTPIVPYTTYHGCSDTITKPCLPKWTGAFKLFDFPRELRDRIYHYAVHRPRGKYSRYNVTTLLLTYHRYVKSRSYLG